ncbi:MAG: hypothetical protein LBM73_00020 [Candidatus Nomurabacteria bacterium]|nr:hypothetical protein [Candidatus Nomurabacteria bacterium]
MSDRIDRTIVVWFQMNPDAASQHQTEVTVFQSKHRLMLENDLKTAKLVLARRQYLKSLSEPECYRILGEPYGAMADQMQTIIENWVGASTPYFSDDMLPYQKDAEPAFKNRVWLRRLALPFAVEAAKKQN